MDIELKNTIKISKGFESVEYDLVPAGMGTFGLTMIKNIERKAFQSDEMVDAFRLIFRHKELTAGYVFLTVNTSFHERSNLYKTLKCMAGNSFDPELDAGGLFDLMKSQVGKWFDIMVEHNKGNNGQTYANIVKGAIMPHAGKLGSCIDYFNGKNTAVIEKKEVKTGFEEYPDADKAKQTQLDDLSHCYDLSGVDKNKLPAAWKLLEAAGGVHTDPDRLMWRTKQEVNKLIKYKHTPIEDDDTPF
jgi:hypothetical protein